MARKSSQNHNGLDSKRSADSGFLKNEELTMHERENLKSTNLDSPQNGSSNKSDKNYTHSTKSGKKSRRKTVHSASGRSNEEFLGMGQQDVQFKASNLMERDSPFDSSELRVSHEQCALDTEEDGNQNTHASQTIAAGICRLADTFAVRIRYLASVVVSTIRSYMLYVLKSAKGYAEERKPLKSLRTVAKKARKYARNGFSYAYPITRTWIMNAGKISILLLMVWLDCNLRGFDSLRRLGTTGFFTVLWCSTLSIFAMIGLKLTLVLMVVAVAATAFVGLGFATLIVAISSMVLLWLYGSFWTTSLVIFIAAIFYMLKRERLSLLVTTIYSMYCVWSYIGWLGLLFGLNLSFISSDILIHFLKSNANNQESTEADGSSEQTQGGTTNYREFNSAADGDPVLSDSGCSADRGPGDPSTSGAEKDVSSEDEVIRLLNCTDHYAALGLRRYASIDASLLKREYRKKAMLVHPDKNMGNEKAAEAFKKLQNAYEILLDSIKRKAYDDELRRKEFLDYFRQFQNPTQKRDRYGNSRSGYGHSEAVDEDPYGQPRRMACKKCHGYHIWMCTARSKSRARWCQDCKDFHQAKDGDGWIEQSSQPLLFGLLQKMDAPRAYVCADSSIFNVTEWFTCQGMRVPSNTHKPSFHVNANVVKQGGSKAGSSAQRGGIPSGINLEETITEEELFEFLQAAAQSGAFESFPFSGGGADDEGPYPGSGSGAGGSNSRGSAKKKKKGKKQW